MVCRRRTAASRNTAVGNITWASKIRILFLFVNIVIFFLSILEYLREAFNNKKTIESVSMLIPSGGGFLEAALTPPWVFCFAWS